MALDHILLEQYKQGSADAAYVTLGAHPSSEFNQEGYRFTVYAPNARKVELAGDFSNWNPWAMEPCGGGFWSIFAKDLKDGELYKYLITPRHGQSFFKSDPFAFSAELRPGNASRICDWRRLEGYNWADYEWMDLRTKGFNRPMSIYEVHPGSWKQSPEGEFYTYERLAAELIPYVKSMGFTHIELMPLAEYPFDGSWGYQTAGYFAPTSRYGTPEGLMYFVDFCHREGIGVILDFVPTHFVKDDHGLSTFDGAPLFESDQLGESPWGTAYFDFTKPHVISFLRSALDYWLRFYHFDGIRFDAVSHLIHPYGDESKMMNDPGIWFMKAVNWHLDNKYPGVLLIAEDSSRQIKVTAPVPYGGLGFDYKWCLNGMHDILEFFSAPPNEKLKMAEKLYSDTSYFFNEKYIIPFSHDEVVHLKGSLLKKMESACGGEFSLEEQFGWLRCLYMYLFLHPGKKLLFMGGEFGVGNEWNEAVSLDWKQMEEPLNRKLKNFLGALAKLYRDEPALYATDCNPDAFKWLEKGRDGVFAFMRKDMDGQRDMYVVINTSTSGRHISLPIDRGNRFAEIITTDGKAWGGSGGGNRSVNKTGRHLSLKLAPVSGAAYIAADV